MLRKSRRIFMLLGSVFICCQLTVAHAFLGIEKKQTELNHINGHIEDLKKIISENKTRESDLQEQLKTTELALSQLSQDIATFDQKIQVAATQLQKLEQSQQKYSQNLAQQRAALADQIRLQYQLGKAQSVKNILSPENFNAINRQISYYHYLSAARIQSVNEINQIIAILTTNMAAMTAEENSLKSLRLQKQNQLHLAQAAQDKRQHIIAALSNSDKDKQEQLATLITNQNGLRNMIIGLQKQTPEDLYKSFQQARGKLSWPIEKHDFSQLSLSHQNGVIIQAPEGTPVHAIYGGKVIFAIGCVGLGY